MQYLKSENYLAVGQSGLSWALPFFPPNCNSQYASQLPFLAIADGSWKTITTEENHVTHPGCKTLKHENIKF